ncbi:16S rRNA (uracil(1498)-N(3))-methyltransferase [Acaricomes phytoseiuli]|uniref:16S rRNA (uracil(1498)-N(3))-methyltransferase n=1 Tax=Acaricomes phytoseiuli TaxID=291968 RepID=UPI0003A7679E|nr:16S rRNA (uracil(1498)-N(3))-methyltransferase [Acaricomes phytoseiuli]
MTLPLFYAEDLAAVGLALEGSGPVSAASRSREYLLTGSEGHHAAIVRRIGPGEQVMLSDGAGLVMHGTVLSPQAEDPRASLRVRVDGLSQEPEPSPRLTLIQALAKDGRDEAAIEAATELGVDCIIPWQADRSIVRWKPERQEKAMAKWRHVLTSAAKQSRRPRVPGLRPLLDTSALLASLQQPAGQTAQALTAVLHEEAEQSIPLFLSRSGLGAASAPEIQLCVVVGPEGGMSEREVTGFRTGDSTELVRLGPQVLRSSTAGPAALAIFAQLLGRWDV